MKETRVVNLLCHELLGAEERKKESGPSYLGFIHWTLFTLVWRLRGKAMKTAYSRDRHPRRTQIKVWACDGATNAP